MRQHTEIRIARPAKYEDEARRGAAPQGPEPDKAIRLEAGRRALEARFRSAVAVPCSAHSVARHPPPPSTNLSSPSAQGDGMNPCPTGGAWEAEWGGSFRGALNSRRPACGATEVGRRLRDLRFPSCILTADAPRSQSIQGDDCISRFDRAMQFEVLTVCRSLSSPSRPFPDDVDLPETLTDASLSDSPSPSPKPPRCSVLTELLQPSAAGWRQREGNPRAEP